MNKPIRIRLSRQKGWRMPPNTVKVDRSTKWGNPYKIDGRVIKTAMEAKGAFFNWTWRTAEGIALSDRAKLELRGKNLACWCHIWECKQCGTFVDVDSEKSPVCPKCYKEKSRYFLDTMQRVPCHADVLLQIANE